MQDNTPRYIVSFSNGKVAKLTEQEYNDSKDQIYQFDRNASAARINDFSFDDDVDDSATYTVGLPNGKFSVFSAQQYRDSREELRKVEGIQIGSLSPVDYWGDKLNALNKQIAELEPKHERAVAELSNPANSWDITDEDLDAGQAIEAARRSAEARDYERDIKKRLTALKKEREANPAYQSARQQRIQGLQDFTSGIESQQRALNEANPESHRIFMAPERNGMGVSDKAFDMRDNPGYYRDMEALGAAKMWIADAVKAEKAPSRYDTTRSGFQNFLTGVTSNVKELSTVLGLAEGIIKNAPLISTIKQIQGQEGDNANIIALVEKMQSDPNALPYLSDAQKTLVRAFVVKTLTDAELSGDTSLGYQAGQSAIASLGFMKDFILTGGEGSIAEAAAKGATKWMTKGIAKASLDLGFKGAGRATAQALPKFAVGTVKGAVKTAIMTPFMPSSYKNLLDNLTRVNLQDGTVDLSGKAVLQAVGDVFIENFSENAGGQVEAILGVPFKALGTAADKVFANTAFSTWGKAVGNAQITKLLKQAGWNGFIGEIGEEWYGNALRVMTGVDKDALKDFATVDQQIITLASFAPMSIFGLGASSGQYLAARKQMEGAGEKLSQILAKNNYSEDQIQAILAATKAENPTELAQLLSPVVNQIAADNGDASEAYKAVCDFAKAIARYRTLDGLRDSDAEGERRQAAAAIDAELGAATPTFSEEGEISGESPWMQQKSVDTPSGPVAVNSVRVLTDANGTEYFVKSESETDGYGLIERGTGRPVAAPTLDGYTDSGVMSLNDFLDREIARKRRGADQVRMAQETLQNRAQIIQQAQLGTQLNLGTEENPVMGTIREIQPGDVFIIESERGTRPYSLQEVADFMRHPLNSLPAEEIDNQTAEMMNRISEKKNTLNQMLIDGTAGPVKYQEQTVIRVIGQDGNGNARILTAEGEDGIDITEDELDALLAQAQQKPVADIQQEEQDNQQPEDVEDTVLRDFRGNPLPLKTNKKGETVVNWVKLWKDDPEAWARWNDAQERPIVDTKLKLAEGVKDLQKEQEKLQKELSKEILHGMDEDKMDDYQDRLATVANRLDVLTKVLNTYNLPAQAADTFAGEQRRAAAEQTIREQQAGFPGIQQKWNDAPKIVGAADEIRLPNGENITGHYVLTEAYAPTPSHNPADGFKMTDGFPVDENGKTVNDRDYEHDADAQKQVLEKAANYDQRALQTPVIVSADGVVLSGNDRTMASQLAAQSGTDGAYVEYLAKYSQKYGFTAEQVQGLAHPRVVFVPDAGMEYNAATFAKFNADDKKSQSKTEKAVKAGKTLSPEALGSLATLVDRYEDINALYNDAAGVQELLDTLQVAEVITSEQIAALKDGDKLSGTGMDLLESTLIGSAMDEEAVRIAMSDPSIRKPIVSAIAQIIANNTIEGYTLRTELTDAIILVAQGKGAGEVKTGESVQNFIRQQHLFMDDVVASATVQMLADAINDRRTTQLKKVLSLYNRDAVDAASGQMSLLLQDVPSRDYILRNILEYLGYDTSIIFDTSERESEQRAAAEASAADQEGNESEESEAGAPVQSDTGSAVNQFDREEVAAILEQGNVGETGLAEYMTDDEVAEFMRLWEEFLPYNDALGEAYNRLGDDLRATADKAKRKAAQAEIDRLEQAQAEAFVPVQDYVDSLLAKYDLFEEPYDRSQDETESDVIDAEEDVQEDVITGPVLEETEGTPGNYHWNDNGVCTNPTIITVPGNDRMGDVCKVSLAENNGTWYAESFVVADGGKGSSWGNRIPSIRNTSVSFGSRYAAVKSAISGIRWLLDNPAKKQAAAFGETYNGAKELIDFLVTTELEKAKVEDTRIVTIIDGLKAFDNAKGNAKFGKVFSQLMKSVGEMIDFADDALNDALKDAAAQFKVEQVRFDDLNRAKAYYTKRVRNALKKVTGNTSMSGYGENSALVEANETPKQEQKPAIPEYGSQNKVITTERYQELLKQWKDKMNNLNSGFDPETMMLGLQLGAYHIEAGARQFLVFSTRLIRDIGESIRPYLKSIYNGVRDFPGMEAYKADMDSASFVDEIDVNTITDTEHVNEPVVEQEETPAPQESTKLPEVEEPAWAKRKGEIQGFEELDSFSVYNACDEYIDRIIGETRLNIAQVDMIAIGSRAFGMAREDSDLDILLEYEGDVKEDEVFNALNAEPLELLGIKVDFFPIRSQESGTLTEWLASHDNGRPVANEERQETVEGTQLSEGDLVVLKNKPQGFDGILKVVGVNSNGTYNLEYNPTGFMPLTRMGEPADNVVPVVRNHREDISQPEVSEPAQEETPITQPSETSGQTIGELGKNTHTKSGKEMSIVRLKGVRLSDLEFKKLKARARQYGGYWSSFKGANGFLFESEGDAIKFNTKDTTDNGETTNKQTASGTAVVVSEAASAASKAEALAESTEPADEKQVNKAVERIDNALEAIDNQLALLGYYEADQTGPFNEMYGYTKSAEKKAVKDADKLAKKLAADLGIEVGRKQLAKANIAPAGGEVSFRLPLKDGHELYMCINVMPKGYQPGYGYEDDLVVRGALGGGSLAIYFRVENPNASGQARYVTPNNNQPYNVSYADLLKAIRRDARNYLPEAPAAPAQVEGPVDLLQVAQEQAEKNRKAGKSKKNSVSSREDGDAALGGLFADLYEAEEDVEEEPPMPVGLGRKREKPTEVNGFKVGDNVIYTPNQGKRQPVQATIHDFEYDGRPVLDTGLAPVLYEVTEWENVKPLNTENDGLQGNDESSAQGTPAESVQPGGGAREATGGNGPAEGQDGGRADSGRAGGSQSPVRNPRHRYDDSVKRNTRNNRVARGEVVYPKTPAARYKANIAAIRLLKELQDNGKQATKEQMAVLRQYTGWGGLGSYFNNTYSPEYRELKSLLSDEEMQAAAMSGNTAFYTPVEVIDTMWDIAKRLGFEGGNVLEGSAGIGNILASMPKGISEHSAITAVELDSTTGGILELLYPDANVLIRGFEEADIPNGSVDLAITNVPFGNNIQVYDAKEKDLTRKFGGRIHDFCIAKNVRKLAEGGIGIFISTRGTLDNPSRSLRSWIVNEGGADIIGAFRLNNKTFEGTGATSDIIIVRKRVGGRVSPSAIDVSSTQITRRETFDTGKTEWNRTTRNWDSIMAEGVMEINSYFIEHPENMGGTMGFGFEHKDTFRPGSAALWPDEKIDQQKRLAKWAKQFTAEEEEAPIRTQLDPNTTFMEAESAAGATKEGQIILNSKGQVCINRYGKAMSLNVNTQKVKGYSKSQVVKDYNELKAAINEVLDYQLKNESDEGLKPLLAKLNRAYDTFSRRYGSLNRNTAISFLRNDVDFPAIAAVEDYKEKKGIDGKVKIEVKKTGIFNGRVLGAKRVPTPQTAKDGVIVSINQYGRIDIPFIARSLGKDEDAVREEILSSGLGFENPLTGGIEVEYEYLSGNVREKLEYAREHNEGGKYDANIKALEKVIPAEIPAHLIEFSLGSDWLPVSLYTEYAKERFGLNDNFVPKNFGGSWSINENVGIDARNEKNRSAGVSSEMLGMVKLGHELMLAAMNKATVAFSKTYKDDDGHSHTEHDKEASQAAATKIDEMRDDFKEWCRARILADKDLSDNITKTYNDTFNAIVPKEIRDTFLPEHFEGQVLTMGKEGKPFHLYPHQAKAVIRATTEPLMMAHEVGTGKTFTLISTAMEMRRLGTAKKPMIVVQNATLGQFVSSAKELYPNAKVLTITESDRTVEGRSAFYAKIKYNDWDIIIVPQSVFEMIPDSEERKRAFIQEKIDEKKFILEQAKEAKNQAAQRRLQEELKDLEYERDHDGEKRPKKGRNTSDAKKTAEALANASAKAKKQLDRKVDDVADFDDMGIDALLIDEAHAYKHLGFSTSMQRGVKGVDPSYSKKSAGVYLKTRAVFDKVGWKNVVFATGTPISNTAAEIWTFMKYLMPDDVMRRLHIYYFDDFVSNFGNISQSLEFTTSGKFKENARFASYTNLPELIRIWSSVTDTVLTKEAVAAKAEDGAVEKLDDKVPQMETWTDDKGESHENQVRDIYLPQSPALVDILTAIRARLEWYEGLTGKEKKENSHVPLVMFGLAKMAAIDPRLVDRSAKDEPLSKTNRVVEETLKALEDSKRYKGTAALFCDNFRRWDTDDSGKRVEGFNIFEEIKRKLVAAGVPEDQIVIMKSGMTTAAKEKIFARVNAGDVRVIMGTTATLGTGVNIQERLFFEGHIDAPNRPMDYTQRMGRILRQGNLHKEWGVPVRVVRFGVEDSLDVTAYQRLSTKSKFINSIMDGKPLLVNGMENRVLEEEEEGEFDNPVAVLSGSQYALLKSQAERELRKLRNKKEQHRQDQIYIERALKDNELEIARRKEYIAEDKEHLKKLRERYPDGKVTDIAIEGVKVKGVEQTNAALKAKVIDPIKSAIEIAKRNPAAGRYSGLPQTKVFKFILDGTEVFVRAKISAWRDYDEKTNKTSTLSSTEIEYYCPEFGYAGEGWNDYIRMAGGLNAVKDIISDFTSRFVSGSEFEDTINRNNAKIERLESDNELMLQRRGQPFADGDKLAKQEALVKDYTEKMRKELAEKEAKYAEMAKNTKTSFNLDSVEIDDEDEEEGETHNSDVVEGAPRLNTNDPLVLAEAVRAVNRLAKRLGLRVVFDEELESKGAYTEGTDFVRINLANCESVDDAIETLLHEGVAHFGLREMLGEEGMREFINDILSKAAPSIRAKIEAMAAENDWNLEYAAEEYVAELAQKTDYTRAERSLWREILNAVRNLIASITGRDTYITDDVIREMLVASYANLEERSANSADNKLSALNAAVQNMSRFDTDYIPTQKKRREIIENYIEGIRGGDKDVAVVTNEEFLDKAAEWGLSEEETNTLNKVIRLVRVAGKTFEDGRIIIFTDNIEDLEQARQVYVHERQHFLTNGYGTDFIERVIRAFDGIGGPEYTRLYLKDAVRRIGRTDAYDKYSEIGLAQEFVSFAMQLAYTEENFADAMKKLYIRPAAIDIIKELDNEQRKESSLSAARRRPADNASDGRRGEDADANRRRASGNGYNGASAEDGGNEGQGVTHYRVRTKPAPEKTGIGYKVFFRGRDGQLYPPMVANPGGEATPVGVWLDADAAPVAGQSKTGRPQVKAGGKGTQGGSGTLAYRPGWHLGEIPYAIQFNRINPETGQRELFPRDFVWAEVEYAADKDYQKDADAEGMTEGGKYRHSYAGLKEVPEDGFYRYRTNPNPETDPWIITGAMKVNRILADEEVDELVRAAGREPQKREPRVSRNRTAYHGSIADFDSFDIDHAGEGEGFQSHGFGHYVALDKDVSIGYAWSNAFDKADKEGMISGSIAEMLRNDSFDDYDSMVERYDELHAKRIEELKQEIADERKEKTPDMNTIGLLETELGLLEKDRPLREVFEGMRNLYTVEIPDEIVGVNYLREKESTPRSTIGKIYDALQKLARDKKNRELAERVQIKLPTIEQLYGENSEIRTGGAIYDGLSLILGSPKEASKFLKGIGIVGIKYIGGADGACAVIFSSEDINIVEHERWRQGGDYSNPSPVRYKESIGARRLSASETATKFGVGVEFRPSSEMRQDGKPLAGRWVDGKIYICLEHCRDNDDAVRTVLHEGVGHQGLRKLIGGENMREFCLDIFRNAPIAVRSKIAKDAVEKYGGNVVEAVERMAADDVIREVGGEAVFESAEEWMAETSETIDYDGYRRNLWDIIRSALRKALAKVGINIPLSVRDVKWIMVQSAFANHETDALVEARRQVVAKELGFTLRQQAEKGEGIRIERNKRAEESLSSAARLYNKDVLYWWSRLHETWVDKDDAVHRLVSAIEKASGKVAETFEDIRLSLNQQSSKGLAAIEKFEREYYEPMKEAIKYIMSEKGCSLEDVERYVMLKHGLERNEVFAKRDARAYYQDLHDGNVRTIQNSDKIDDITKLQLIAREDKKLQKNLDAIEAGTDSNYLEFRKQDYGGLTAMYSEYDDFAPFDESLESNEEYQARVLQARHPKYTYIDENGREKVDMAATEDAARKEVEAFESGSEDSTKNLWERINAATKATLKHQYDSNMMSREQYLSVSKMFKYYVPLRGFADNTAEDMYDYYHSDQRNIFTPPLLVAKGRKTEAESPFGYIGAMASSGIAADMKNETKLALYYFVSNRADNDLASISEVWYKVTGVDELGRKIFTPVYPPFKEDLSSEEAKQAFRDWEEQMKEEAKAGLAYKGMRKLDLHKSVIHIDENQKTSHIIRFKVGGKDMMMYINGNPRAAQAINNELNVEMSTDYQKFFGKILRYFSGINTSYNPEFWLSNAQRDALFAMMSVSAKEDPAYNEAFRKNIGKILAQTLVPGMKGGAYSLKRKLDNGTLGDTPIENLYREFVENGGVTGYTTLKSNEEWELELRKYTGKDKRAVKAVKTVFGVVQDFGEAIEQMTRFAAYMTSREQGKDIKDSVNDAKELTVNFNRKGSGKTISWQEAGRLRTKDGKKLTPVQKALVVGASWLPAYGRRFIMFFNASTQGLNAMYKLFKKNPGKMGIWTAAYFALGVIQAIIHALLDDDDDYLDIPDYERRNNLLLGGRGVYFKWALPQEARVFYAMGDMVVNHAMGREPHKSILSEVLAAASDIAPLNPSGGLSALAPSALTPVVEVIQNRDYKGAKIYNDMRYLSEEERKRTPAYQKAYQSTGRPYILISQFLNWVSGGDYADAGWININPASVEHILKGATGGAGTTIGKLYRGTFGQLLGEDFSVRNTPFLSRILTVNDDRYRNAHTTELFDYYKAEAEHTKKLINTYRKNGDDDKLDRLYDSEDYEIMLIYDTYKGELQYYNDELKITEDKKERKALMREQDAIRKQMILEISNIGKND